MRCCTLHFRTWPLAAVRIDVVEVCFAGHGGCANRPKYQAKVIIPAAVGAEFKRRLSVVAFSAACRPSQLRERNGALTPKRYAPELSGDVSDNLSPLATE